MTDVSGIPNMGFGGGSYFGGNAATGQPAYSAADIQRSIWGNYSPGAAQATANNIYGAGGFGAQPAYYAALGAAYGRQVAPSSPAAVAAYHGGGGAIPGGSKSMNLQRMGMGGIGSDAARVPDAVPTQKPAVNLPENWEQTFNNTVNGNPDNPTVLGDSSWYPSQRTTPDLSTWYAGLPGGAQAYNSWNLGLPAQGGFGVPGAGGGAIPGGSASMNRMRAGGALPGDIGFTPQSPMPNLGYNPSMQHQFANPGMNANQFQNRFGMGFPNAGTPSQYAPGAQMPPGFLSPYSVDNPQGALPLGWSNSFNN